MTDETRTESTVSFADLDVARAIAAVGFPDAWGFTVEYLERSPRYGGGGRQARAAYQRAFRRNPANRASLNAYKRAWRARGKAMAAVEELKQTAVEPAVLGTIEESVDHAVNMGINAWNDARYDEAAAWFRDAAAHCERVRKERREQYERETEQREMLEKSRV